MFRLKPEAADPGDRMTQPRLAIAALIFLAAAGDAPLTGQAAPPPQTGQGYTSTATAILVDVVVRDRKGRPVTGLSEADFEVFEDGVAQRIDSFSRVSRGGGIGVSVAWRSPTPTVAVSPAPQSPDAGFSQDEGTAAIVFDHLSAETLRLAQKATLEYVPMSGDAGVRIGVFATDPGVRVLQPYTADRALVRRAIAQVLPSGTSAEEQKGDRTSELLARRRELQTQTESETSGSTAGMGPAAGRNAAVFGQRDSELGLIETELGMIRSFDNLDRGQRGYDTWQALLAVVRTLSAFAGRKTLVFFSEGLPVSPALSARLDSVIEAANRANVTAYAVDANGLRTKSTLTNARKEMEAFGEERLSQAATGSDRTSQPLTMAFERVEDTLTLDSRTGLARLAHDTGGFLVEGSNDLGSAFRRIDEDTRFHYLLTYSPANAEFDGKFRAIQVKVRGAGLQVFARNGYRAVPAAPAFAGSYEGPALALLDRTPVPNAFPSYAAAFSFPDPVRPGLTPVLVHVGSDVLRLEVDAQRATYSGQAAVVVRIRDGQGRVVQTFSQQYVLSGDAKDLEAAKAGEILFYREPDLTPGVYSIESIVYDAIARQGSARIVTVDVPGIETSGLHMSSLVLVNRIEEVPDAPASRTSGSAPLYVGRSLLYPNLGDAIRKTSGDDLPFYFTLYGAAQPVKAYAQLLRNGQELAEAPVALGQVEGARVQHVGRLPIRALPAGTYELRIRVTDGTREVSRSAYFTLRD